MNHTSIFVNCSKHYEIEVLFEDCIATSQPCQDIANFETARTIDYIDYDLSTVLFLVAGLVNIHCLATILPLFCRMHDSSKKKYVFLVCRVIGSIITVIAWLLVQCIYVRFVPPITENYYYYVVALSLYDASVYVLLGSYVGMSIVLYFGVLSSITFYERLSIRVVYGAVHIIFIASFALSIPLAIFQSAILIPGSFGCEDKSCAPLVTLVNFVLVCGAILLTSAVLMFVLLSLFRHRSELRKTSSFSFSNKSLDQAFRLISWTFCAILLIALAEVLPFTFGATQNQEDLESSCQIFYKSSALIGEAVVSLIESFIWSVALIIDPLANILFDETVSGQVRKQVKWIRSGLNRIAGILKTVVFRKREDMET